MDKICVGVLFCVIIFQKTQSIYTREELSTKPPFTKKYWSKPALQPEGSTFENYQNSQVTVHHNYSRVHIHGSNPNKIQENVQKPLETIIVTQTRQTKTYTFPPETVNKNFAQTEFDTEPVWIKPDRYTQSNIETSGTKVRETKSSPKGHYIVREQSGPNLGQFGTQKPQPVSSEIKVHDKMMRLEEFEDQSQIEPSGGRNNNGQNYKIVPRPNYGTDYQGEVPITNYGSSGTNYNQRQFSGTLSTPPRTSYGTNYQPETHRISSTNTGTNYRISGTSNTDGQFSGTHSTPPGTSYGTNYQPETHRTSSINTGTNYRISETSNTEGQFSGQHSTPPETSYGTNYQSETHRTSSTNTGTNYRGSGTNYNYGQFSGTHSTPPGTSYGTNYQPETHRTSSTNTGTNYRISGTNNTERQFSGTHSRPPGTSFGTNYQEQTHTRDPRLSGTNTDPNPSYTIEYRPVVNTYKPNTKQFSNMAFENCPKNSTGPVAYLWSCSQFLNCWKGRGLVQNCAPGTEFNPETLECDYPHKVNCISGPHDQKVKFEKYSNVGDAVSKICKPNFAGLLPHPTDCTKFINCAHGQTFIQNCGPGTAYNEILQGCDHPHKTGCVMKQEAKEIVGYKVDNKLDYTFDPNYDQNFDQSAYDSTAIRVYDTNNIGEYNYKLPTLKQVQVLSQNCGQNCGNTRQLPHSPQGQTDQNCGPHGCGNTQYIPQSPQGQTGQNNGQNCGPHGCGNTQYIPQSPQGQTGQNNGQNCGSHGCGNTQYNPQSPQTQTDQNNGQNCGPNGCGNTQYIPQSLQGQTGQNNGQNCGPHGCDNTQYIPQNPQGQTGQNNGQNCGPHGCGNTQYIPQSPQGQTGQNNGQNCGPHNCGSSQTIPQSSQAQTGQNCGSNCGHNQQISQAHRGQTNGQNCSTNNCGATQHIPQIPQGQNGNNYKQNCGQNPCPYSPQNSPNCGPGNTNCQGQNNNGQYQYIPNYNSRAHSVQYPQYSEHNGQNSQQVGQSYHYNQNVDSSGRYTQTISEYGQNYGQHGQNFPKNTTDNVRFGREQLTFEVKCPTGHNGLYPHPYICEKFLNCANGQTFVQDCGPGTVFNPKLLVCDWPYNVQCTTKTTDDKREISSSNGQNYGQNTGQNYGQSTQRNTTRTGHSHGQQFGQNIGSSYGQNSGQYGQNSSLNYGQNSGQYYGQTRQRNTSSYGQNTGSNYDQFSGQYYGQSGQNIKPNNSQNSGQYYGQSTAINTTRTDQMNGQYHGQQFGHNTGSNYDQTSQNIRPIYNHNSGQYHGQTTQTNTTRIGQNSGQQFGQTTRAHYGQPGQYSGSNSWQTIQKNTTHPGPNQNGNYKVIGYRTDPPRNTLNSSSQIGPQEHFFQKPEVSDYENPVPQILEPPRPVVLNYTINVKENSRKTGRHWPPPFPSTDTSADYYFEDVTETSHDKKNKQVWKKVSNCAAGFFGCGPNECIPNTLICDGVNDCKNGADEKNCKKYLDEFKTILNSRLYKHEVEKWLNTDLDTCANYCLNSKSFICKSFNYRKSNSICMLCDTNVALSGALAKSHLFDYYEQKKFSVNCSDKYKCSNEKCINYTQICDGNDDCGDRQDEKNCSKESIGYEIKLAGSEFKNEGRIEVKVFNELGFICDDQFGLRNADVVCKELGYSEGALEVKPGSYFAKEIKENDTYYLMDDVQCIGNETSIRHCDFNGWGIHNCMPQEIVGVICKTPEESCLTDYWKCDTTKECLPLQYVCDGVFDCEDRSDEGIQHCEAPIELRIVNGSSKFEGRVEVRYHGVWGTICDDDFNDMTAKVVCKSLGYYGSAVAKKDAAFGEGTGPILLDQLNCYGNESSFEDCGHWNWGEHNCEHSEDAGVVCSLLDTSLFEKKSKDENVIDVTPVKPNLDDTIFRDKCGYRGDDLFTDVNEEGSDLHFRVVKGSKARKGDYPWQATIRIKGKLKSSHWCGAIVISNKYVLTAAHCLVGFSKGSYFVRAGDYDVSREEGTETEAFIEDFFIHERFRQGGHMNNDIAVIKLKGPGLKLSKYVQPICLPDKNTKYKSGLNCTISGFGSTETGKSTSSHVLRAGWVTLQPDDVCKMPQVYGDAITPGMICAGSLDEGVDSCDGDSGGPLACLDKGLFTLFGITSWGQRCGHVNKPGVYVKVAEYRDWIDKTIQNSS